MSNDLLSLTPALHQYLLDNSLREPEILSRLREQTASMSMSQMQISPEQGQFMQLLLELINAKKTLDIGVFTGYSALIAALSVPEDGLVVACDINGEWTKIAKKYWELAGVTHKIDLRLAPALDTLQQLIDKGEANSFDFAFIDADKVNYAEYYEKALILVKAGGLIAIDNTLWEGKVVDLTENDKHTSAIRTLNTLLHQDLRVSLSLIPIGDGLTLLRKR